MRCEVDAPVERWEIGRQAHKQVLVELKAIALALQFIWIGAKDQADTEDHQRLELGKELQQVAADERISKLVGMDYQK